MYKKTPIRMSRIAHPYEEKCPYHWAEMPKALGSLGQNHGEPWAKSMVTLHIIAYTFYHDICKYLSVACLH